MIKAVYFSLCCLLLGAVAVPAQTSPGDTAVNEAVMRQAQTIVLRQKLADARRISARGDIVDAAVLYQEAYELTQKIGSGIRTETQEAVSGLVSTRLTLARQAQRNADYLGADKEVTQALKAAPQNSAALEFKKQNDHIMKLMAGRTPSPAALEQIPAVKKDRTEAGTMVQDGKLFYEMGKLDEADAKLKAALQLDPDNQAAFYYLNLVKQARYSRESLQHTADTQARMNQVEKSWVLPVPTTSLPEIANQYATNPAVYTGPGRGAIMDKLSRIKLDSVSYDGVPLGEVLRDLTSKVQLRDPEKKGINFIINPNADNSGRDPLGILNSGQGGGGGGGGAIGGAAPLPGGGAVDPTTGLPAAAPGGAGGEALDIGADAIIKLSLTDVTLANVLEAIQMVSTKPIKYSIRDYAIVFQARDTRFEPPLLTTRMFKVDPNTFYSGLESVSSESFGSVGNNGGSGGGSSGGGGGGGSSGGGSGNNSGGGGVVGIVDAVPGASSSRNSGGGGGGGRGGGGGGGAGGGSSGSNPIDRGGIPPTGGGGGAGGGGASGSGGLKYITKVDLTADVSLAARDFFTALGVNLRVNGKSVFFNDRLGLLVVRATEQDLDVIEQALQVLNTVSPQVHIKARFIQVQEQNDNALGFQWYLGNYASGQVVASGGTQGSLYNSTTGTFFPSVGGAGNAQAATDQLLTGGLSNPLNAPTVTTITGILTNPNFQLAIQALSQRQGVQTLAEPEVTVISGRQTQMKATTLKTVVTDINFQQGTSAATIGGGGGGGTIP